MSIHGCCQGQRDSGYHMAAYAAVQDVSVNTYRMANIGMLEGASGGRVGAARVASVVGVFDSG